MSYQNEWSLKVCLVQEQVQLIGFLSKCAGRWPRIAPGLAGLIIGANMSETRDARHYECPIEREISAAVQKNHGRFPVRDRAGAVDMQSVPSQVDHPSRRGNVAIASF